MVGEVFVAGEEADEGTAVLHGVVADGSGEGGVRGFDGVEDAAEGDGLVEDEVDFVASGDVGVAEEWGWEFDSDGGHGGLRALAKRYRRLGE